MPKLTPSQAAKLSDVELMDANSKRNPTNQLKPKCPAVRRSGDHKGEPCGKGAGVGTSHPGIGYCSSHGGNTPAGKKAAARQLGRDLIADQKERFGGDRRSVYVSNITAEQALLEEVRRSTAMVRFLEERIGSWEIGSNNNLDGGDLGLPRLVEETSKGAPGATDVQAWLLLYREERAHAAKVAKMCIDANISKRMVDLAESQGTVLKKVITEVLKALNLTDVQLQAAPTIIPMILSKAQYEWSKPKDGREARELVPGEA